MTMKTRQYLAINDSENMTYQMLNAAKAILRGTYIASNVYIKKKERPKNK